MPQKLLKDKEMNFKNDEEFIDYFVKKIQEKKKQEKLESTHSLRKQSMTMSEKRSQLSSLA